MNKENVEGNKTYYLLSKEEVAFVNRINSGWLTLTNRRPDGSKRIVFEETDTENIQQEMQKFEDAMTEGGFPIIEAPIPRTD